ncbi:hypothetical protein WME89_38430 [Sorangium sp. So ce321]|uniref:hypothetical protein n=1 Tax=Sorangium sp. So ce321 TaxID=3133300 RepID=UPI003F5E1DBF
MTVDRAGAILLSGSFTGTVDLGAGPLTSAGDSDILIAKLDEDGALVWGRRYGGPGFEYGARIGVLGDGSLVNAGVYVDSLDVGTGPIPGAGLSDIYVMQTDPLGNPRWVRTFGDPEHQDVGDMAVDTEDNVVLVGSFEGTVDFGTGPHTSVGAQDAFVVELDRSGNTVWSRIFGSDASDGVTAVSVDPEDKVVFIGNTSAGIDLGGGPLAPSRAYVAKLDTAGNHVWSRLLGDGSTYLQDIDADRAGNLIVTGSTPTTIDLGAGPLVNEGWGAAFIAKLDPEGNAVWSRSFTTSLSFTVIGSVAADGQGNVIASGVLVSDVANSSIDFDGTPFSSGDIRVSYSARTFLAKFDAADGHVLWVKGFDTAGLYDVTTGPRDRVLAKGVFTGTIDFGTGPLTATSEADPFIAAFGP